MLRILRVSVSEDLFGHRSGGRRLRRGQVFGPASAADRSIGFAQFAAVARFARSFASTRDLQRAANRWVYSSAARLAEDIWQRPSNELDDCGVVSAWLRKYS